jgi:hypothetical protein
MELDVSAFIVKPVSQNALQKKLRRVLTERIKLKTPGTYAKVVVPDESNYTADIGTVAVNWPDPNEGDNVRWLPVSVVAPGSVLAKDLRTGEGSLLLKAGAVLSAGALHRLLDAHEMNVFSGNVPIMKAA